MSANNEDQKAKTWEQIAEAAEQEAVEAEQGAPDTSAASPEAISLPTHEELLAKINELEASQDKMVRMLAEKENSIRRLNTELEKAGKFAVSKLTQDLLAVLDSLELSLQAIPAENEALQSFRQGIEMTLSMLLNTLEKQGVKAVNPLHEKFDPNFHEAISMQEHPEFSAGTVINVFQKGYLLHERVIRPAMVVVSKEAGQ